VVDTSVEDDSKQYLTHRTMVLRMPRHVKRIQFVLDVSPGAVQALDEVLSESSDLSLSGLLSTIDRQSYLEGRRTRIVMFGETPWRAKISVPAISQQFGN